MKKNILKLFIIGLFLSFGSIFANAQSVPQGYIHIKVTSGTMPVNYSFVTADGSSNVDLKLAGPVYSNFCFLKIVDGNGNKVAQVPITFDLDGRDIGGGMPEVVVSVSFGSSIKMVVTAVPKTGGSTGGGNGSGNSNDMLNP